MTITSIAPDNVDYVIKIGECREDTGLMACHVDVTDISEFYLQSEHTGRKGSSKGLHEVCLFIYCEFAIKFSQEHKFQNNHKSIFPGIEVVFITEF